MDNERNYKVCKSTITNRYIKGGHFSIQNTSFRFRKNNNNYNN